MRSVWLLQLYASEAYRRGVITDAAVDAADAELPLLLTTMLCEAVERRLTRELSVGFSRRAATLHRVRGKIDVYATQRHRLLDKGQIRCEFNELTSDHPVKDRKSTRLNSSHVSISYAVFCLKKKKRKQTLKEANR